MFDEAELEAEFAALEEELLRGALAAIDARVEDHWDRAWGASDSLPSLVRRRACIDKIDAVLAQYDTPERFAN